jgi:hypothetical protein
VFTCVEGGGGAQLTRVTARGVKMAARPALRDKGQGRPGRVGHPELAAFLPYGEHGGGDCTMRRISVRDASSLSVQIRANVGVGFNKEVRKMKLLIAAGETVSDSSELPAGVRLLIDGASEILVMSPTLVDRLAWLTGDVDRARRIADERLATVLGQLGSEGHSASGVRGDELPGTSFADAILQFSPDHVLIGLRAPDRSGWQERGLLEHLLGRFGLPLTVFVAGK